MHACHNHNVCKIVAEKNFINFFFWIVGLRGGKCWEKCTGNYFIIKIFINHCGLLAEIWSNFNGFSKKRFSAFSVQFLKYVIQWSGASRIIKTCTPKNPSSKPSEKLPKFSRPDGLANPRKKTQLKVTKNDVT